MKLTLLMHLLLKFGRDTRDQLKLLHSLELVHNAPAHYCTSKLAGLGSRCKFRKNQQLIRTSIANAPAIHQDNERFPKLRVKTFVVYVMGFVKTGP